MSRRIDSHGRIIFSASEAIELLYRGSSLNEIAFDPDPELDLYNQWCKKFDKLGFEVEIYSPDYANTLEEDSHERASNWFIEENYKKIDIDDYVLNLCENSRQRTRVINELRMYKERDLYPLLRAMIYLVDEFRKNEIVWGVGRGSSVSSYVLFKIGLHKIDSLLYDLPITEFLK